MPSLLQVLVFFTWVVRGVADIVSMWDAVERVASFATQVGLAVVVGIPTVAQAWYNRITDHQMTSTVFCCLDVLRCRY